MSKELSEEARGFVCAAASSILGLIDSQLPLAQLDIDL